MNPRADQPPSTKPKVKLWFERRKERLSQTPRKTSWPGKSAAARRRWAQNLYVRRRRRCGGRTDHRPRPGTPWIRAQTDGFTVAQVAVQIAIGGSAAAGCTVAVLQMDAMVLDVINLDGGRRMHVLVQKAAAWRPLHACGLGG